MPASAILGSYTVGNEIVVKTTGVAVERLSFSADHWHEYPDHSLELVGCYGEVVASFVPGSWEHIYYDYSRVRENRGNTADS